MASGRLWHVGGLVLLARALAFAPNPDLIIMPVDAPARGAQCVDSGPYPCEEEGCPDGAKEGGTVSCTQMGHMGLCSYSFKSLYQTLPPGIAPELQVREACPASCHWCCKDLGPFECTEKGSRQRAACPGGESVTCTQLAASRLCGTHFKKLYKDLKDLPEGVRADAKVKEACRVSCEACDELEKKDEL